MNHSTDLTAYPPRADLVPGRTLREGRYEVRFARCQEELDAALRLRFEVFNLELDEGLESSVESGRDSDAFDPVCHHLLVIETVSERIVGTYRMQTAEMARRNLGFYSSSLFDLSTLPPAVIDSAMEVGRACVAKEHRNTRVLFLLWKGLALYVAHNHTRYLFGCCSLTSQDPDLGWRVARHLDAGGRRHPEITVAPASGCLLPDPTDDSDDSPVELPILFRTYLRYGALVLSPPAIDREFKTIDYLVMLDVDGLSPRTHQMFFG